nr:MAG TPA: hypothetical protein [Caudoviricetes sp.]
MALLTNNIKEVIYSMRFILIEYLLILSTIKYRVLIFSYD